MSDLAALERRASASGVYRLWPDLGYPVGALLAGLIADLAGAPSAIVGVALLTTVSGAAAGLFLAETAARRAAPAAVQR